MSNTARSGTELEDELQQLRARIAELEQAERTLAQNQAYTSEIMNLAADAIISADSEHRIILFNHSAEQLFGYAASEVIGQPVHRLLPEAYRERHVRDIERFGTSDTPTQRMRAPRVIYGLHKDGTRFPAEGGISHMGSGDDTIYTIILRDISERQAREDHVNYQAALLDTVSDAIISTDLDLRIRSWNRAAETIYGYAADEVIGQSVADVLRGQYAPGEREQAAEDLQQHGHWTGEVTQHHRDGTPITVLASTTLITDQDGTPTGIVSVNHDITARKRAEAALRRTHNELEARVERRTAELAATNEQLMQEIAERKRAENALRTREKQYRTLVQQLPKSAVLLLDNERDTLLAEGALVRDFGLVPGEHPIAALWDIITPEYRDVLQSYYMAARAGEKVVFEQEYNERYYWVQIVPVVDENKAIPAVMVLAQDISERKQWENQLRKTVRREMTLNEMRSRFLSMAAHDLRNPLSSIDMLSTLLYRHSDGYDPDERREFYERIKDSIRVMVDLLDDIVTIGKIEAGKLPFKPESVDIHGLCSAIINPLRIAIGVEHNFDFRVSGGCGACMVDPKLVQHIANNLLTNAIKYSPAGSTVQFHVLCEENQLTLVVSDEGIGIPPDDQMRLFEAFHRAENVGSIPGTGLGMAIVKQSVDLHGGAIHFESSADSGTRFTVTLPFAEQP